MLQSLPAYQLARFLCSLCEHMYDPHEFQGKHKELSLAVLLAIARASAWEDPADRLDDYEIAKECVAKCKSLLANGAGLDPNLELLFSDIEGALPEYFESPGHIPWEPAGEDELEV